MKNKVCLRLNLNDEAEKQQNCWLFILQHWWGGTVTTDQHGWSHAASNRCSHMSLKQKNFVRHLLLNKKVAYLVFSVDQFLVLCSFSFSSGTETSCRRTSVLSTAGRRTCVTCFSTTCGPKRLGEETPCGTSFYFSLNVHLFFLLHRSWTRDLSSSQFSKESLLYLPSFHHDPISKH